MCHRLVFCLRAVSFDWCALCLQQDETLSLSQRASGLKEITSNIQFSQSRASPGRVCERVCTHTHVHSTSEIVLVCFVALPSSNKKSGNWRPCPLQSRAEWKRSSDQRWIRCYFSGGSKKVTFWDCTLQNNTFRNLPDCLFFLSCTIDHGRKIDISTCVVEGIGKMLGGLSCFQKWRCCI